MFDDKKKTTKGFIKLPYFHSSRPQRFRRPEKHLIFQLVQLAIEVLEGRPFQNFLFLLVLQAEGDFFLAFDISLLQIYTCLSRLPRDIIEEG